MKEIIGNLLKKENVRQNLSSLRQEIKDENALAEALKLLAGEDELLVSFMGEDDAKTRKNAALLIGDLHMSQLSDEVFKAYEAEQMRFVKGSYLAALSQLDCKELLPQLMADTNCPPSPSVRACTVPSPPSASVRTTVLTSGSTL